MHKPVNQLLTKEMDRREFLAHIGAGVLAVVGVTGLLKSLNDFRGRNHVTSGYGSSMYGGKAK